MSKPTVVLASGNKGKLAELQAILKPLAIEVRPQGDLGVADAEETGLSFVENAILKARNACEHTGLPALADDSGLEVFALDGAPGIYSARYDGPDATDERNNAKLLEAMKDLPAPAREAQFRCVIAFMRHSRDPSPLIFEGSWRGSILHEPRGSMGFGYDPLFLVENEDCSAAELPPQRKAQLSHRGQAMAGLIANLDRLDPGCD